MSTIALSWPDRHSSFAGALLDPDIPFPDGIGKQEQIAPKRFSVYRNNVVVGLMEALEDIFPATRILVGQENFDKLSRGYVARRPPRSPLVQVYGEDFADFLQTLPATRDVPFLADLARLERAWLDAYHAEDATPVQGEQLAGLAPEATMELVFPVLAATSLLTSQYAIADMFAVREDETAWPDDFNIAQSALVARPAYDVYVVELDAGLAAFFSALINQQTLAEAIGAGMTTDAAFAPADAIALMFQSGAFGLPQALAHP